MKKLFLVHCVDTEGPLHENLDATFNRVFEIFNEKITPNKANLKKLQNLEIELNGKEFAIQNLVKPERIQTNKSWAEIEKMWEKLNSKDFRYALGINNHKWVFTWFILDHVGFTGVNPRNRTLGDHKIFDRYFSWIKKVQNGDHLQWHYHPLPNSGDVNASGIAYLTSGNIWEILAKKVIQRSWFPSVYRPGFHTIRPDSNWFIDQWFPFDFSNQSIDGAGTDQPDLANHRYGDWSEAPSDWSYYKPSYRNYQVEGECYRYTFRCLNVEARLRVLNDNEIKKAFQRASNKEDTILAFTNHDFRDMVKETLPLINRIRKIAIEYPDVEVIPTDALSAARKVTKLKYSRPDLKCELLFISEKEVRLEVKSSGEIHGIQPFFCFETKTGKFNWENLDIIEKKFWSFTFDINHIHWNVIKSIGIACNSPYGITEIWNYSIENSTWNKILLNDGE